MWWEDVCHRDRLDDPRPHRFRSLECTDSLNSNHFLTKIIQLLSSSFYIHHESPPLAPQRLCLHSCHRTPTRDRRIHLSPCPVLSLIWLRPRPRTSPPSCEKSRIYCHLQDGPHLHPQLSFSWRHVVDYPPDIRTVCPLPSLLTCHLISFRPKRGPSLAAYTKVICSTSGSQLPPQEIQGYLPFPRLPILCPHVPLVSSLFRPSTFPLLITFLASKHFHYRDRCIFPSLVAQFGACPGPCL
jgi:hypothetical protein